METGFLNSIITYFRDAILPEKTCNLRDFEQKLKKPGIMNKKPGFFNNFNMFSSKILI